jgi:tetratricopeptide (TPR) repeat protein
MLTEMEFGSKARPVPAAPAARRFVWPIATVVVACLVVGLTYSNSISKSFHADDPITVFAGPTVKSVSQIPRYFFDSRYAQRSPDGPVYRPLVQTTYAIDHAISGDGGVAYHSTNLVLHALTSALFGFLLLRLLERSWPTVHPGFTSAFALAGAALFAAHPMNSEAVNYVSARSSLLAGAALAASLLLYAGEEGPAVRIGRLAASLACFAAALLSREAAVAFPLAIVLFDLAWRRGRFRRRIVPWMTFAFLAVAYLGLRKAVIGSIGIDLSPDRWLGGTDPYLASDRGILTHFLTSAKVYFMAAGTFFAPVSLSVSHEVGFVESIFQGAAIVSLFALLVITAGSFFALRRLPLLAFGTLFFLVFMLPANGFVPVGALYQEHRTYVPAMGLILLAAEPARRGFQALSRRIGFKGVALAGSLAAVAIIVAMAGVTHVRNRAWSDNKTLFEDAVSKSPESPRALHALGIELQRIGRFDEAELTLEKAVSLRPQNAQARLALARVKEQNGKEKESEDLLVALVSDFPRSGLSAFELGLFYQRRQKVDLALDAYTKAIQNEPSYVDARLNLGWLYRGMDRKEDALRELKEVLRLEPDHRQATMIQSTIDEIEHPKPKKTKKPPTEVDGAEGEAPAGETPKPEPPSGGDAAPGAPPGSAAPAEPAPDGAAQF